jgi:hypothetical protein
MKSSSWFLTLLVSLAAVGCSAETTTAVDATVPTVSSTVPASGATSVAFNANITATFSEAVAPASLTAATFTLKQGTTPVTGTVTVVGAVATFAHASPLAASTTYTASISTGATDLAGNPLAAAYSWTFTTGVAPDVTPPTVSSTVPASGAIGVAINASITTTFSEAMAPASLTAATVTLKQGTTPVAVVVTAAGSVATMAPVSPLAYSTTYDASISVGATDLAGNALAAVHGWSFTTGLAPDTTPPTVVSTLPGDAAVGVAINGAITATFSEAMAPATITSATVTLKQGTTPVTAAVTLVGLVATLAPTAPLAYSTTYTASISTGATDLAGNALAAAHGWTFTTGLAPDTTPPTVLSTSPADLATGVVVNGNVTATFSEAIDVATLTTATFTLAQGATPVAGAVTAVGAVATLVPAASLAASTSYTATISTGAKDLAGNALAAPFTWSFTTAAAAAAGPAPVVLGTASTFAILSKTGVTDVPTSAITGDVGTSPISGAAIGLTCPEVKGHIYAVDATGPACALIDPVSLTTAVGDMMTAYADAAGRVTPDFTELGGGNIDGLTLIPGLYKWGTTVSFPIVVTLSGGANDVWIFQIAQDLMVGNNAIVTLSGGAQARNVFWQVGGAATIGTTAQVAGTILSATQIAINTGAILNGRALAQTAVTLDQTVVTLP